MRRFLGEAGMRGQGSEVRVQGYRSRLRCRKNRQPASYFSYLYSSGIGGTTMSLNSNGTRTFRLFFCTMSRNWASSGIVLKVQTPSHGPRAASRNARAVVFQGPPTAVKHLAAHDGIALPLQRNIEGLDRFGGDSAEGDHGLL